MDSVVLPHRSGGHWYTGANMTLGDRDDSDPPPADAGQACGDSSARGEHREDSTETPVAEPVTGTSVAATLSIPLTWLRRM